MKKIFKAILAISIIGAMALLTRFFQDKPEQK